MYRLYERPLLLSSARIWTLTPSLAQAAWNFGHHGSNPRLLPCPSISTSTGVSAAAPRVDNSSRLTFQVFHTFSGSRFSQPNSRRDWIVTSLWVWAMDALAAGLIIMILGSYYMWWRLKKKRGLGLLVLAAGVAGCGVFAAGLL